MGDGSFKLRKSFDTADKLARHIMLIGEEELASDTVKVKNFSTGEQQTIPRATLLKVLRLIPE